MKLEISIFKVYFKCGHGLFLLAIYHNSLQVFSSNSYINIEMQYIEIIYYHFVDRVRSIESILTIFGFHSTLYSIYSHLDYIKCKNWLRKGTKPHYKHSHGILHAKSVVALLPSSSQLASVIWDFVSFVVSTAHRTFFEMMFRYILFRCETCIQAIYNELRR